MLFSLEADGYHEPTMADSKDVGITTQSSTGYRRGSVKDIEEKQRMGKGADLDLPTYDDAERRDSAAANISGMRDNTHRKLKPRHIQLIG